MRKLLLPVCCYTPPAHALCALQQRPWAPRAHSKNGLGPTVSAEKALTSSQAETNTQPVLHRPVRPALASCRATSSAAPPAPEHIHTHTAAAAAALGSRRAKRRPTTQRAPQKNRVCANQTTGSMETRESPPACPPRTCNSVGAPTRMHMQRLLTGSMTCSRHSTACMHVRGETKKPEPCIRMGRALGLCHACALGEQRGLSRSQHRQEDRAETGIGQRIWEREQAQAETHAKIKPRPKSSPGQN